MPTYELSVSINAGVAAGAPICALRSTTRRAKLKEMRVVAADTTQTTVGLGVPAAPGAANSSVTPVARGASLDAACTAQVDIGWSAAPTVPAGNPTPWNRSEPVAGVVGQGLSWVFPDPEEIPKAGQIVLFNAGAGATGKLAVTLVFDE